MQATSPQQAEEVVLLSPDGKVVGRELKNSVHHADTPLHLAFSVFLFDGDRHLLIQRRALDKKTWPGVWSNSCCGHPMPGEPIRNAVHRRVREELGVEVAKLRLALPYFSYRAEFQGIVENELCPVFVGYCSGKPKLNPTEVDAIDWVNWSSFVSAALSPNYSTGADFSPWCISETMQLVQWPGMNPFLNGARAGKPMRKTS